MVLGVLQNLRSRLPRTVLTVAGIAIGILALVVVGSLAEQLQTIVARSTALDDGVIFAFVSGRQLAATRRPDALVHAAIARIRAMRSVRSVVPEVMLPYDLGSRESNRFDPPSLIFGYPDAARRLAAGAITIARGRELRARDRRVAVVGADFASSARVTTGDLLSLYGNSYRIVGELGKSFTIFDAAVIVPFSDAQDLMRQFVPPSLAHEPADPISALMVVTDPGAPSGLLARRITLATGLATRDPAAVARDVASTTRIFDAIIFGSALTALLIGAFSIVNTMTIAVSERTREIGIRKAIGAGDGDVLREFLLEAAAIGGAIGLAAAVGVVEWVNWRNAADGSLQLFAVTPRLAFGAVGFATVVSALAGLVPAIRAARLAPTDALRRVA